MNWHNSCHCLLYPFKVRFVLDSWYPKELSKWLCWLIDTPWPSFSQIHHINCCSVSGCVVLNPCLRYGLETAQKLEVFKVEQHQVYFKGIIQMRIWSIVNDHSTHFDYSFLIINQLVFYNRNPQSHMICLWLPWYLSEGLASMALEQLQTKFSKTPFNLCNWWCSVLVVLVIKLSLVWGMFIPQIHFFLLSPIFMRYPAC